ncbi:uncharacterized protein DUF349 [Georgenia soli]|uniref:Uncharacterized protein DUF349 n=1 Tax=Georgenia soli TaxID=638953 RepID=A0A2A9EFW8_9MICO|nr:DUF349 domain-containing protein [Georgenia soli]PFG37957.1 uncharacterized protein DUF349 [Georgenia soli]
MTEQPTSRDSQEPTTEQPSSPGDDQPQDVQPQDVGAAADGTAGAEDGGTAAEASADQASSATDVTGSSGSPLGAGDSGPAEESAPAATDGVPATASDEQSSSSGDVPPSGGEEVPPTAGEDVPPTTGEEIPPTAGAEAPQAAEAAAGTPVDTSGTPEASSATEAPAEGAGAPESPTGSEPAAPAPSASAPSVPSPSAMPRPRPVPRPVPTPAAVAPVASQPAVVPPVDPHDAAEAAAWGRVDDDGTVWVREASGERSVGQYTGADTEEALGFYVRRFLDLQAQVALFEARLPQLAPKEIDQTLATLSESLEAPAAVGDVDGLRQRLERLREGAEERRKQAAAEREAAKAQAVAERTAIVEKAEQIAEQDPARTQWKQSGQRLRDLLEEWKNAQRNGPRLDRATEDKLWKRFSHARTAFDRHRRQYFSELDAAQSSVKDTKERLIARAEELSSSTDWGRTAAAYRQLMDEWKAAGRASRKDDDALWARFRAAQQRFFDARSAQNAEIDAEYGENLKVKLALLEQAEALLPVTDPRAARAALRPIQDQWDEAGKVPRAEVQRVEGRMRAVEQAVRDAEQAEWDRSNPETRARVEGAAAQLHSAIEQLEAELEKARAGGDAKQVADAEAALEARRAWLDQIQRAAQG